MKFDVIIIGGGIAGLTVAEHLQKAGFECALISEGRSIHNVDYRGFTKARGVYLNSDRVVDSLVENDKVLYVRSENMPDEQLRAEYFVLATGKFFGRGIVADMDKVYEPLFGLDVKYLEEREAWFDYNFAAHQPFLDFGVKVDAQYHPFINSKAVTNLFAVGEVVEGCTLAEKDDTKALRAAALEVAKLIIKERDARK